MKAEILKMLREADGYISGQEICEKFNVSRTAVWKVIRRLQEDGYEVEAVHLLLFIAVIAFPIVLNSQAE